MECDRCTVYRIIHIYIYTYIHISHFVQCSTVYEGLRPNYILLLTPMSPEHCILQFLLAIPILTTFSIVLLTARACVQCKWGRSFHHNRGMKSLRGQPFTYRKPDMHNDHMICIMIYVATIFWWYIDSSVVILYHIISPWRMCKGMVVTLIVSVWGCVYVCYPASSYIYIWFICPKCGKNMVSCRLLKIFVMWT